MTGHDTLSAPECWELLSGHDVGRLAYTESALPTIVPVAYVVVGAHLVLRFRSERIATQLDGQVVALEVDDVDHGGDQGRTVVVVTGRATRLLSEHATEEPHCPPGCEHRSAVRLEAVRIAGQRLPDVA